MAVAIVTAGAGARGAYEAGVLSVVVPRVLEEEREVVLVGTSAGAINTAIVAGHALKGGAAIAHKLRDTWKSLDVKKVYRGALTPIVAYMGELAGLPGLESYGLLDTTPLRHLAESDEVVQWGTFPDNFDGWLKAAGVVTTDASSGESVVFVEGPASLPPDDTARGIVYRAAHLAPEHVLASSAIPIAFPGVRVGGDWHVDGGVRLNTPISPGIDLLAKFSPEGPKRMIVVSTDPDPDREPPAKGGRATGAGRPDILAETAMILHSILVDRVSEDLLSLRRINAIVGQGGGTVGDTRPAKRAAGQKFHVIEHAYFGPSSRRTIPDAAGQAWKARSALDTPLIVSLISRALGRGAPHDELLSYLLFDKAYLTRLVEMGQADAERALENGFEWES